VQLASFMLTGLAIGHTAYLEPQPPFGRGSIRVRANRRHWKLFLRSGLLETYSIGVAFAYEQPLSFGVRGSSGSRDKA
jgi:hypothetical protein